MQYLHMAPESTFKKAQRKTKKEAEQKSLLNKRAFRSSSKSVKVEETKTLNIFPVWGTVTAF